MSEHHRQHSPDGELTDDERGWYGFLTGDYSHIPPMVLRAAILQKALFGLLPTNPRCESCNAPFRGLGGLLLRPLGFSQSDFTPRLCNFCLAPIMKTQTGVEIELSMLFADIRGSIALAEGLSPNEFARLVNRFYIATTGVLVRSRAFIDRLQGDEVIALCVPGFAGPDFAQRAVQAAQALLEATGHADPEGPWIPVGVGVHTGTAYVGAVGSPDGLSDITALGYSMNTAARLASRAAPGEIILSEEIVAAAQVDAAGLEQRALELKGKSQPVPVRVMNIQAN